jgi:uncharacterized membrane protein
MKESMPINGKVMLATIVLGISCFVIANTLVQPQPISIKIGDGTPIVVQAPAVYGEREVLTMIITSWIVGISTMYLYFEGSRKKWQTVGKHVPVAGQGAPLPTLQELETINTALKVLREPGKRILEVIVNKGGEVLQRDLYLETDFSKAKISRTLRELEARNIIQRRQYGGTKKVILSDWMRKEPVSSLDKPLT